MTNNTTEEKLKSIQDKVLAQIKEGELRKLHELHDREANKASWGSRPNGQAYRLLSKVVSEVITQPSEALDFKEHNKGEIALMPVAMRRHLNEQLDRVGNDR